MMEVKLPAMACKDLMAVEAYNATWKVRTVPQTVLDKLQEYGIVKAAASSCRLEGNALDDRGVWQLLSTHPRYKTSHDEEEVISYASALSQVMANGCIMLTEEYIKELHSTLYRGGGSYKTHPNMIATPDGRSVVFNTAAPSDTPHLMKELIDDCNGLLDWGLYPPLIIIAIFVVHFLAIHPFPDGNGRLSRLLTTQLLLNSGYGYCKYQPLEPVMEWNRSSYYLALHMTQRTLQGPNQDHSPWISFLSSALHQQTQLLDKRISACLKEEKLQSGHKAVFEAIKSNPRGVQVDSIRKSCPHIGSHAISSSIHHLIDLGLISKTGYGKGTWYLPCLM